MIALKITPVGNLVFSKTPMANYKYFGSHSIFDIPPPTTVAGAIGNLLKIWIQNNSNPGELLGLEELGRKLMIRGPLLEVKGSYFVPVKEGIFIEAKFDESSRAVLLGDRESGKVLIHVPLQRVGVSLKRGYEEKGKKESRPGRQYRYIVSSYVLREGDKETPVQPSFVYLASHSDLVPGRREVIRLGGEGGMAVIEIISSIPPILQSVSSPMEQLSEGYYIALSHIPLLPKSRDSFYIEDGVIGLEPFGGPESVLGLHDGAEYKLKVVRLGLGFSEFYRKRRPQILALPPGTVINVRTGEGGQPPDVLKVLYSIGFASLLKIGDHP